MEIKNYCIMVMGDVSGAMAEIVMVAEDVIGNLDAKGVQITTFSSAMRVSELTDFFKQQNRNFFLFEINPNNAGYNILNAKIAHELFGKLPPVRNISDEVFMTFTADTWVPIAGVQRGEVKPITDEEIDSMNSTQREELMNSIIDKGISNWTDDDKRIITRLSQK
jgi:hypothetical protein